MNADRGMAPTRDSDRETRVLLLAPTRRDGEVTQRLLAGAGLACLVCRSVHHLSLEAEAGAGAILLTEEALDADEISELLACLSRQPSWSDLPVVMLMRGGVHSPAATSVLSSLTNVTLLERPTSGRSVVSAVRAAVRSRERQYQIRHAEEERERLLESERAARGEAERANRSKDEFLAVVSHELRSPLNAIGMAAQLLKMRRMPDDECKAMLRIIAQNVAMQRQLIEDLLDVSRIVSGKLRLHEQVFDVRSTLEAALAAIRAPAEAKGIEVVRELTEQDALVRGDQSRLQQVIGNLLSNAVKFTPAGGRITLGVSVNATEVKLTVSDTGCGIDPTLLPHVFDRFRQADSSMTRKHGGLGLGLSIVRQLVQLHGGNITATSPGEGAGSTFTVCLPRASETTSGGHPRLDGRDGNIDGLKVLLVDDDADFAGMMERLLTEHRAEVSRARSANEALGLLEMFEPDLLLSDIGMPGMDGYEFIRLVRARGKSAAELPAAAVTAFASAEDRKRALLAGYQGYIAKPVDGSELVALLASLAGRTGSIRHEA